MHRPSKFVSIKPSGAVAADRTNNYKDVAVSAQGAGYAGCQVVVNVTARTASTLVVTIQGYDEQSGTYFDLLASATINATGVTVLTVHPSGTAAANSVATRLLPRTIRVKDVTASSGTITYSIGMLLGN